ncbi:MAG: DUF4349 domain-containing protein [Bacillota bacterium]
MRRTAFWLALLFLLSVALYGCGAGGGARKAEPAMDKASGAAPAASPAPQAAKKAEQDGKGSGTGAGAPAVERKIIQNAQLDVKVKEADEAISTIGQNVRAAGGYVQETRVEGTRQHGRRVNMTVRVPAGAYGSLLDLVAGLGEVTNRREWINDVTEEYLDLDARIRTKETHLEQLRRLYAQGGTIKELMELESEIARVTAELESIKGRFNFLSNQVAYSTIIIGLYEPGVPAPIKPPATVWERMQHGFISSWNGVVNFTAELAIFFVSSIPALIYLAVVGLIIWALLRWINRRFGGRPGSGPRPPVVYQPMGTGVPPGANQPPGGNQPPTPEEKQPPTT